MFIDTCRICGQPFFADPVMILENMPKSAQNFPDEQGLINDKAVDLYLKQCRFCGLVQLINEPVTYYREVIRAASVSEVIKKQKMNQISSFLEEFDIYGKKVAEFGCGSGDFLSIVDSFNVFATGVEFSEYAVSNCRTKGLNVVQGYPDHDMKILQAPFDAFFMFMFLEHMPDPNDSLRAIHEALSNDAVGMIEVPNFDMVIKKGLFSEFIIDHLFYFTEETLTSTLNRNGFEVIETHFLRDGYVLCAIVKKRKKIQIKGFLDCKHDLLNELKSYIKRFEKDDVAVWGAGHQSLTILSMLNLSDRIKYVVDSATFKQDRYTPATHIKIVGPERLFNDPVEAVIIMAASYSDEVLHILQKDYSHCSSIAVLRENKLEIIK